MTSRAKTIVADLRHAAGLLRASAKPGTVPSAVAELLELQAHYWTLWLPSDPSNVDRAFVNLAKLVNASHDQRAPDADAGTRQQETPIETEVS